MNDEHAQTVGQLEGTWSLVSSEFRSSAGDIVYPFGEDALGLALKPGGLLL